MSVVVARQSRSIPTLVLGLAAFLIFYRLGAPSLWLDEAAAPLNASLPVSAILELSQSLEEHPPLFYLLLKAFLTLGKNDFIVRLLPALAGLGCVALVMAVGTRLFSRPVGLAAAALWLAMPQDLWLSRMARPYSLWLFFYLCALYFLAGFLKDGRLRSIWGLLASAALMVATHYLSFPLLAAMGCCLLLVPPLARPRSRMPAVLLYAAGCAGITAAAYFGLIRASQTPALIAASDETMADAARAVGEALLGVLYLFEIPLARLLVALAAGLGFWALLRADRRSFTLLAILTLVPLGLLVALGKATGLYARHLSGLGIPIALAMASGLGCLPRLSPRLPAVTVAVLALAALGPLLWHRDRFYAVGSYQVPIIGNNYKLAAAGIAGLFGPATVVSFGNAFYGNVVSWYLAQSPRPNAVDNPGLTPDDRTATLLFAAGGHWGYLAESADDFDARIGRGAVRHQIETSTVLALSVPRDPVRRIPALPGRAGLPMGYRDFFATANIARGVRHHQNARGPAIIPIQNDAQGQVRAVFALNAPPEPQEIRINVLFDNTGQDNTLAALVRFDDEPPTSHPLSTGYDATHQRQIALRRDAPYTTLTVDLLLRATSRTPTLAGGSQETLRLTGLEAFFCPARDAAACLDSAERHLTASLLANYLEERFSPTTDATQAGLPAERDNIATVPDSRLGEWSARTPADPSRPGVIRLTLATSRDRLSFFPRVGQDGMVRIWATHPNGGRRLLFALQNLTDRWTPISARYEFIVPDWLKDQEAVVDLELTGRWSQVWTLGDALLF
ncbi:glycosyltransferase family 39 protein [Desulfovibrio sp. DV]|uniref:glycosyltransferase family 39 protein n=1 Tax=Desulfovibrio sp. DV TaxID=1844708 RepID=UPI00094BC497|nr:glycosyltransferase family 39 protein [Desulfovibrio sp. DV]